MFAGEVRRQRVSRMRGFRHWRWHLDEMDVKLNGELVYLWRAVDHKGEVLESYVTRTRDKDAALIFMKKALKRHGSLETITTDGLRSYEAAMTELGNTKAAGSPAGPPPMMAQSITCGPVNEEMPSPKTNPKTVSMIEARLAIHRHLASCMRAARHARTTSDARRASQAI
jgi:transposase-like protein